MRRLGAAGLLTLAAAAWAQDVANGRDVYGPCAACHGANGEGGKGGEYPRVAGQPASFLVEQLLAFQQRRRNNLPMFPYTEPRELSVQDMRDVAAYLAGIELPTRAPELPETASALERLLAVEKVLVVPRVDGDVEAGAAVFKKRCAVCHGKSGQGKKGFPRLLGQYPNYLRRQLDEYRRGGRPHESEAAGKGVLTRVSDAELDAILAWLTAIQDLPPEDEAPGSKG